MNIGKIIEVRCEPKAIPMVSFPLPMPKIRVPIPVERGINKRKFQIGQRRIIC